MNVNPLIARQRDTQESKQFHDRRLLKDRLARLAVRGGGVFVLGVMMLLLFYLAWVVFPLFGGADVEQQNLESQAEWAAEDTLLLSIEEQSELGLRIGRSGMAEFFAVDGLQVLYQEPLLPAGSAAVSAVATSLESPGMLALALDDGRVSLFRQNYAVQYSGDVSTRRIDPSIEPLFSDGPLLLAPDEPIKDLAFSFRDDRTAVTALSDSKLHLLNIDAVEDFLTGERRIGSTHQSVPLEYSPTGIAIDAAQRWIYVGSEDGTIRVYNNSDLTLEAEVSVGSQAITSLQMLLGGTSVLAGDAAGAITQLFPVRSDQGDWSLTPIRSFNAHSAAITQIIPEHRRRGFLALDADGFYGLHHSTSERTLRIESHGMGRDARLALSPRATMALILGNEDQLLRLDIDNPHPEVSLATLWRKVWYENYTEPTHTWQSTAATNEFEPKFSLAPLAFGTLKAALYAMLFAIPLALMGATYTAIFMAPKLRQAIKPTIEIMAALPTVILGFLAGLWLAPFIEQNLSSLLCLLMIVPTGLFVFAYFWQRVPGHLTSWLRDGWEPLLLLPVLLAFGWLALSLADPLQQIFFAGSLSTWMNEQLGIPYDQRNAMIVGIAMGFSVIPTIFSIAEDALFAVPRSLSNGSLALGATRWQTLVKVVLPTASPGIFSGLMIGMGRAVGETMIVLMATGNTPIMDFSMFEGMRTLAANIAIEMPESEVQSTHFRILFLSALVLFVFTFLVNTGAEVVRQRLRARYSAL